MTPALALLLGVAGTLALGWVAVAVLAYAFQRRLQYLPSPGPVPLPDEAAAAGLEEVSFVTSDGVRLLAWHWPRPGAPRILFLHGNGGHRGHRLGWIARLHALGCAVLLPDWRGYGGSEGRPTEAGLARDADAAMAWLRARGDEPVIVLGSSLGGSVAVGLAARSRPAGLVLQGASHSLAAVGQRAYPFLPVRAFLKDAYEVAPLAASLADVPALIVHGTEDAVVPIEHGRRLRDALAGPTTWFPVEGAGHDDVADVAGTSYDEAIASFVRAACAGVERAKRL